MSNTKESNLQPERFSFTFLLFQGEPGELGPPGPQGPLVRHFKVLTTSKFEKNNEKSYFLQLRQKEITEHKKRLKRFEE